MVTYKDALNRGSPKSAAGFEGPTINHQSDRRTIQLDASFVSTPLCHRLTRSAGLNPYRSEPGETLPPGYGRNFQDLLIRYLTQGSSINLDSVNAEADFLRDHTVNASFVGKKIPQYNLADWI
jgi:hypothetical protein